MLLPALYLGFLLLWGEYLPDLFLKNMARRGHSGYLYTRLQNIKDYTDVDILFIGSSHAYRGFDTRIFKQYGFNTFNLGSSAQTPLQTDIILKRHLDKLNPKLVVYEVFPETFVSDGVESSMDLIANDFNDFDSIKLSIHHNNIKVYNTLFYAVYCDFFKKNDTYLKKIPKRKRKDTYIDGGFVEKDLMTYTIAKRNQKKLKFNKNQFYHFDNIITLLKEKKIPFILVQAPITKSLYNSYLNRNTFDEKMKQYGRYIDFNKIIELDDELNFYDSSHLNQHGVEVFNRKFIEIALTEKKLSKLTKQSPKHRTP